MILQNDICFKIVIVISLLTCQYLDSLHNRSTISSALYVCMYVCIDVFLIFLQSAFQDLTPYMIASEASLEDVQKRTEKKIDMRNFRPNIIASGCPPFDEVCPHFQFTAEFDNVRLTV